MIPEGFVKVLVQERASLFHREVGESCEVVSTLQVRSHLNVFVRFLGLRWLSLLLDRVHLLGGGRLSHGLFLAIVLILLEVESHWLGAVGAAHLAGLR